MNAKLLCSLNCTVIERLYLKCDLQLAGDRMFVLRYREERRRPHTHSSSKHLEYIRVEIRITPSHEAKVPHEGQCGLHRVPYSRDQPHGLRPVSLPRRACVQRVGSFDIMVSYVMQGKTKEPQVRVQLLAPLSS